MECGLAARASEEGKHAHAGAGEARRCTSMGRWCSSRSFPPASAQPPATSSSLLTQFANGSPAAAWGVLAAYVHLRILVHVAVGCGSTCVPVCRSRSVLPRVDVELVLTLYVLLQDASVLHGLSIADPIGHLSGRRFPSIVTRAPSEHNAGAQRVGGCTQHHTAWTHLRSNPQKYVQGLQR